MQDRTTINTRLARFETNPVYRDGLFLAGFYSKTGEYLKAVNYYRRSVAIGKPNLADYAYDIFENMANAVWQEKIDFDSVFPTADAVLISNRVMPTKIVKTAQLMTRLCRKFNRSHDAAKYLEAGMQTTLKTDNNKQNMMYRLLLADQTLYIKDDTVRAIAIKKDALGPGWENERDKFYDYAQWCLEREIDLDEAEKFARKAIDQVYPGKYRARVLNTVAEICFARGKKDEAIEAINRAIDEEPNNLLYQNQLERFQGGQNVGE